MTVLIKLFLEEVKNNIIAIRELSEYSNTETGIVITEKFRYKNRESTINNINKIFLKSSKCIVMNIRIYSKSANRSIT